MQSLVRNTTAATRLRWSRRLIPSLSQWLWLTLLLMLLAQPWRTMMVASDGDPCLHWRVGEWMLAHRHMIHTDEFSHTRHGQPFVALAWLAEIAYAVAGWLGGLYGLAVVAALAIATTFALLHRQLIDEGNDVLVATGLAILAITAACLHWLARPLVFTLLIALLWNRVLRRFEREGRTGRLAFVLGLLMLFWVNLHGGFFLGFIILGAYWLGALLEVAFLADGPARGLARRKLASYTLVSLVCGIVTLANPYGYHAHQQVIATLRSTYLLNWFGELSSSDFSSPGAQGFLIWLAVTYFTLAICRPSLPAFSIVMMVVWTYLALYSMRNISLLVLLTAPILAPSISEKVAGRWAKLSSRLIGINRSSNGWGITVGVAILAIVCGARPTEMPRGQWPVAAVDHVREHPQQFRGNMFNLFIWGGYLMRALPEHEVFVDGRADFYGEDLIREFDAVTGLHTNWIQVLDKYKVRWTLMPSDHRLNLALALLPGWRCSYSDEVATVYSKAQ